MDKFPAMIPEALATAGMRPADSIVSQCWPNALEIANDGMVVFASSMEKPADMWSHLVQLEEGGSMDSRLWRFVSGQNRREAVYGASSTAARSSTVIPRVVAEPLRSVDAMVVTVRALIEHREFLPAVLTSECCDEILSTKPMQALLQHKWALLQPLWLAELIGWCVLMACYFGFAIHAKHRLSGSDDVEDGGAGGPMDTMEVAMGMASLVLSTLFLAREFLQMRRTYSLKVAPPCPLPQPLTYPLLTHPLLITSLFSFCHSVP
jgi:hypothetical protein